ncbi:hypothetical protein [Streptomyces sp. CRN 30]|uniref:DUF7848 domain-containing protein n=1 Tax=Streptomyces sp. CRN 30 TaxID=3075613 RepID=UPI002A830B25|nr:hypothetical protein [Streptomyces sp. CRN 30]
MEPGSLVYDLRTHRVGEYRARVGPYVLLRPVGGGREWEADPAEVRAATPEERLSAGVRAANDRSAAEIAAAGLPVGHRDARWAPFTIVPDASARPEYEARCVSGEEADCGAGSGARHSPSDVEEWQRRHTQETRHTRYRRSFADYTVLEADRPPAGADRTVPRR